MKRSRPKVNESPPEFFEVFLPDRNSLQLCIPADFIKHFEGTIPNNTILKDLAGKIWHVDLKQQGKGLFFANGWQQFVKDKSLQLGDFIVFRYNQNSEFTVRVFGNSGCMKEETSDIVNNVFTFVKQEDGYEPEAPPTYKEKYSASSPLRSNNVGTGRKEINPRKPRITTEPVDQHQDIGTDSDQDVASEELCFTTSLRNCPSRLHIPKRLLNKYNIELNSEVVLRNQSGESWSTKVLSTYDNRRILSRGWSEFCKDNKVGFRDKLKFQYVLSNGRECKELIVSIIRVGR